MLGIPPISVMKSHIPYTVPQADIAGFKKGVRRNKGENAISSEIGGKGHFGS